MSHDRGHYGPLDRDRHFVIGWSADHTADYARARAIGATVGPVLPAIVTAARASRGASRWWVGSREIGGRDEAARPLTEVGQEFFHTVADRLRAITMLSTGFKALASDLATWQTANKDSPDATTTAQWLAADVTPTLDEWKDFAAREGASWWTRAATSWETFEGWWERLKQLRTLARAHGVQLQSAEPVPLPKTIWQKSSEGKGSEATALIGILKIGVFAALTITGAVSLYAIVRELKPKKVEITEQIK